METHEYGIECGNVDSTLPMLAMYYYTIGVYILTLSSSDSNPSSSSSSSSSDSSSGDENEDEPESSHNNGESGNPSLLKFEVHATPHIDVR